MNQSLTRGIAALLAASALTASLAAGPAAAQVKPLPSGPAGKTETYYMADIIPTTLGFAGPSGFVKWGDTDVVDNPSHADATQVGPQQNLCRFHPVAYRTHNKGDGDAGAFVVKTYANGTLANTQYAPGLAAKQSIDWHQFAIDLKEGMNVVRVVYDANKQVAETDEKNTFQVRLNVKIDCNGDGQISGVSAPGGLKQAPGRPDPDPRPTRKLQLKPAN